ncbi:MAG TPA: glycoside hydrolase family 130 protein [Chthoniobacterales bacterium]|nr:glycoside hydrolase family 130 protein [Chthoniobacterales bacterium]
MTLTPIDLRPSSDRVLNRPFIPTSPDQVSNIIERVLSFSDAEVEAQLACLRNEFAHRHPDLERSWLRQFAKVEAYFSNDALLQTSRRLLIGAFFTGEYAVESVALFNPSIVPHPNQTDLGPDDLRFILALRGIGEGHISSIEFRSGLVRNNHSIEVDNAAGLVTAPDIEADPTFSRNIFLHKLQEKGLENNWSRSVMNRLGATFTRTELDESLGRAAHESQRHNEDVKRAIECLDWLVNSNYELNFSLSIPLSQRVIFPVSLNESHGMEDARFVRFVDEDDRATYYATYTAYDGRLILPQLIETNDFLRFRIRTLTGPAIQNKGMALFPRRIDGRYAMLSRYDDENLYLMLSDDLYFWSDPQLLVRPSQPWELVKIGNCGSPIETDAGWLVLTHGVGPMRKYCIGALLLDLQNPFKVIGRLKEPLLKPAAEQTNGYVPNVVYSCGALIHGGRLILPYGLNDTVTKIVTIDLETLLAALVK